MTIVALTSRSQELRGWQQAELQQLIGVFAAYSATGSAREWATGTTELSDPQFFILGDDPEQDCLLAVARVGRIYVLENGTGAVLAEDTDLAPVAEKAIALARRPSLAALYARIGVAWCVMRSAVEEKVELLIAEPVELLSHVAPQLVAIV
jgi:hypothetical protein